MRGTSAGGGDTSSALTVLMSISGRVPVLAPASRDPNRSSAVSLRGLTRFHERRPAVVGVNLDVDPGEATFLRGPNGAGKSTLLRLIATAIHPTFGGGLVCGRDLIFERSGIRPLVELLGHRGRWYDDLTAAENLRFVCSLYDIPTAGIDAALESVGLGSSSGIRVRDHSEGMRKRLSLARVLIRRPELLLMDEPYAGLDDGGKDLVDALIREAANRGSTVILAGHERREGLAGRTVTMERGAIVTSEVGP